MFGRSQGVQIPEQQLTSGTGEPNTIIHAVPMQLVAIQYCDESGGKHDTVAYVAGDVVYMDMNAERWASGLRQASGFIKDAVLAAMAPMSNAPVPTQDDVDIVSDEVGSDASNPAAP